MAAKAFLRSGFQYLHDLNFFKSPTLLDNQDDIHYQRLSTRVFIITFIILLGVLLVYNCTLTNAKTITIPSPTLQQYNQLHASYPQTLTCPCSQISINRRLSLNVTYSLHQICGSMFVTPEWISYIGNALGRIWLDDFRHTGPLLFQGIQSLCQLAQVTIDNSVKEFQATNFVSAVAVSEEIFQVQVNNLIQQFIKSTASIFAQALRSIRDINQANALLSGRMTNYNLFIFSDTPYVGIDTVNYDDDCSCTLSSQCTTAAVIYGNRSLSSAKPVPGFYLGCYLLEGLRQSRLECLYDQSCLDELRDHLINYERADVIALDPSGSSRFSPNTPFGDIVDDLMVDAWNWIVTYEKYYEECMPKECSYIMISRNGIVAVVTTLVGLMGGLITALKLIIPRVCQIIRWKISKKGRSTGRYKRLNEYHLFLLLFCLEVSVIKTPDHFVSMTIKSLVKLNLFESISTANNLKELHHQRISTRVFTVTFIVSLLILLSYNTAITHLETVTIMNPSVDQYQDLYSLHSETLTCPCSQISVNQQKFLNITYSLHQICSSVFITSEWISYIGIIDERMWLDDFRYIGPLLFQGIRSLCQLGAETIAHSREQLYTNNFISALALTKQVFQSQADSLVQQFIKSTINRFLVSLRTIRDTNQVNAILSGLSTNYYITVSSGLSHFTVYSLLYDDGCTCEHSSQCITSAPLYRNHSFSSAWSVPGFYVGCYILEGLRRSPLECLYDQSCLDELRERLTSHSFTNVTPLKQPSSSRFSPSTPFGDVLDELMVDAWNWTAMYEAYYEECQPKECSYTMISHNGIVAVVTISVGLVGGLITALKLIVPRIVQLKLKQSKEIKPDPSKPSISEIVEEMSSTGAQLFRNRSEKERFI